ncbi:MAG: ABC transporter ATP-binding protein [Spirochaetaceae bacterium]|nr:ABC transporter ATP-binding protein [Spirochaetaceae bacterium]
MILVKDCEFSYDKKPFISDVNFEVGQGEIFGFLGPSGAGKSTLQKILIGLLKNYKGSVQVFGKEVREQKDDYYEHIGIDFEFPSFYEKLTAVENLKFFSSLYKTALRNIDSLLEQIGLLRDKDKKLSSYSKGMKSRLNFVKALVHNPELLFLDEPTSGLDPSNSRIMKNMILEEKKAGKSIILTTHNMQDAAELCDRVAFIVDGHVKAMDTPHNLIMKKGAGVISYSYLEGNNEKQAECSLDATGKDEKLKELIQSGKLLTIHSMEPDLGDIFMEVTGRGLN